MFTTMYHQRHAIKKLGLELERHNTLRGTGLNIAQLAKSKQARSSFVSQTAEMHWLLPKFEAFTPTQWYTSIVLLVIRLVQTSLMALVPSQLLQTMIMCCVTLVAILLQSELAPYRRSSDNTVALLSQVLMLHLCEITNTPTHSGFSITTGARFRMGFYSHGSNHWGV